jgi:hypothetical protein
MAKKKTTDAGESISIVTSKQEPAELALQAGAAMPRLTKYQKFTPMRIARRDIQNAPYNPRIIDAHARKELTRIIRSHGMVSAITWNKRSGNIVGGHQRLGILDALEGAPDYSLDVDMVDVDDREEVELNIILNNPAIQGTFDVVKFEELFNDGRFDAASVGLSDMDLQAMLPDNEKINAMFSVDRQPEAVQKAVGDLNELQELQEREKDRIRAEKKAHRNAANAGADTEWHTLVWFKSREEREHFMELMGSDPNERYLDGRVLLSHLEAARLADAGQEATETEQ